MKLTSAELEAIKSQWYKRGVRDGQEEVRRALRELLDVPSNDRCLERVKQATKPED